MDRFSIIKLLKNPYWIFFSLLIFNGATADEVVINHELSGPAAEQALLQATPTQTNQAVDTTTQNNTAASPEESAPSETIAETSGLDGLAVRFPSLQRALIILTIINFVIIVFGLMMYLVKRRMQQFSPASLARLNQEG